MKSHDLMLLCMAPGGQEVAPGTGSYDTPLSPSVFSHEIAYSISLVISTLCSVHVRYAPFLASCKVFFEWTCLSPCAIPLSAMSSPTDNPRSDYISSEDHGAYIIVVAALLLVWTILVFSMRMYIHFRMNPSTSRGNAGVSLDDVAYTLGTVRYDLCAVHKGLKAKGFVRIYRS